MSDWNNTKSQLRAIRSGQVDGKAAKGGGKKNKKPRPWKVMSRLRIVNRPTGGWEYVAYRGVDEAACRAWIEKQSRSYFVRRQDTSERTVGLAQEAAKLHAEGYWIVAPKGGIDDAI